MVDYIKQSYGWAYMWSSSIWHYLFYTYYFSFVAVGIYLTINFSKKTENTIKKKQAKIIYTTSIIALVLGTLTNAVLPELNIFTIPQIGNVIVLILAFGIVYAIVKYKFLIITPATAADNIISTMTDSLVLLDSKGNIVTVNKATLDLLRYRKKELEGESVDILFAEENFKTTLLDKITQKATVKNYESIFKTKSGENISVNFSSSVLRDEEGTMGGIVCIARDITEHKKMEEKLSAIYEFSREMSLALDIDQISEIVSDVADKELNFKNFSFMLIDEERKKLYTKAFRGYREEFKAFSLPLDEDRGITVWVAKNGKTLYVSDVTKDSRYVEGIHGIRSELAVPIKIRKKVIGVLNVESEKLDGFSEEDQQLLETLALQAAVVIENAKLFSERERKFRELKALNNIGRALTSTLKMDQIVGLIYKQTTKLMDTTNFFLALFDERTKKLDVVLSVENGKRIPKFSFELGKGLMSRVVKTKKPLLIGDYLEGCKKFGIEPVGERKSKAWLSVPLVVKDKVVGVLNVHSHEERDIYTKEDLEILSAIANYAVIAIENARLFEKERETALQLEFLNDLMSHDINNINQIAMGYLELLKTPKLSEKQNIFLEKALNSVRNSARLIDNVRKLQKLRGGKIELERIDLKSILEEVISEVSQHPEKNVEVKFSPKENMWINGSPFLKDVFFNLLDNAIKYTPSKNVKIEVNVEDLGNSAKICVKDWGVGIPDEMKSTIFERFERLENGVRGSGLGLYISKMIVAKLNGRIWVEDNPEGGSVFCIELLKVNK